MLKSLAALSMHLMFVPLPSRSLVRRRHLRAALRRSFAGLLGVGAMALVLVLSPGAAAQTGVRECGHRDVSAGDAWGYDRPRTDNAEYAMVNLTTRRVASRTARRFSDAFHQQTRRRFLRFSCRFTPLTDNTFDTRCTASRGRVIRWQTIANG